MEKGNYTIDRFEEDYAVLEDCEGCTINVARADVPDSAKEGDTLCFDGICLSRPETDSDAAEKAKSDIKRRFDALIKKKQ